LAPSADVLAELTLEVLRDEIGIKAFGDRVRIMNGIKALVGADASSSSTSTPAAAASVASTTAGATLPSSGSATNAGSNALDLVVLHAAPLVIKDTKGRIYPMEKLDLEAERRAITTALLTDVRHKAINVRFEIATADILRSLMTTCRCRVSWAWYSWDGAMAGVTTDFAWSRRFSTSPATGLVNARQYALKTVLAARTSSRPSFCGSSRSQACPIPPETTPALVLLRR